MPVGKDVVLHDLVICGGVSGLKLFSCFMFENLSHDHRLLEARLSCRNNNMLKNHIILS